MSSSTTCALTGDQQRVAGLDCQVLLLEAKDGLRYARKLWADKSTGLLLKAQSFNEKGDIVEQIAFTQVEIGGGAEHYHALVAKRDGGRELACLDPAGHQRQLRRGRLEASTCRCRASANCWRSRAAWARRGMEVGQVVFSDGLASISVFLEPIKDGVNAVGGPYLPRARSTSIRRKRLGTHVVTVLGEAPPPACVTRIGKAAASAFKASQPLKPWAARRFSRDAAGG